MFEVVERFAIYFSPVIVGLLQVIKSTKLVDKKFLPLASISLGVIMAVGGIGFSFSSVVIGLVAGLTASGLYSFVKPIVKK